LKDEGAIDWREGFRSFHWTRGTSSRKGHGGLPKERGVSCVGKKKKKKINRGGKDCFLCGKKLFMEKMGARKKNEWGGKRLVFM